MILRILLIFLFLILCGFLLYFLFGVFIPAVKSQIIPSQDPLFAEVELNYTANVDEQNVVVSDKVAFVENLHKIDEQSKRLKYNGIKNCALFSSIYDTANEFSNTCVGFGDCIKVCPQEAIKIENNVAVITKNCCGCGECVDVCPKKLIKLVPKESVINSLSEQKYFKFWKSWYKMFSK